MRTISEISMLAYLITGQIKGKDLLRLICALSNYYVKEYMKGEPNDKCRQPNNS